MPNRRTKPGKKLYKYEAKIEALSDGDKILNLGAIEEMLCLTVSTFLMYQSRGWPGLPKTRSVPAISRYTTDTIGRRIKVNFYRLSQLQKMIADSEKATSEICQQVEELKMLILNGKGMARCRIGYLSDGRDVLNPAQISSEYGIPYAVFIQMQNLCKRKLKEGGSSRLRSWPTNDFKPMRAHPLKVQTKRGKIKQNFFSREDVERVVVPYIEANKHRWPQPTEQSNDAKQSKKMGESTRNRMVLGFSRFKQVRRHWDNRISGTNSSRKES